MHALLITGLLLSASPFAELGLDAADEARLEKGEVVVKGELYKTAAGKNAGRGKAWVLIARTADESFSVLTDYEKHPQFMPRLNRVTFLDRKPHALRVIHDVKIVLSRYRYTLDLAIDRAARTMSWTLDRTVRNDITDTTGEWRIVEAGPKRALVQYTIAVDSGLAVPGFLEEYLTRRDLPEILDNLRRRIESGGTWRKD